MKIEAVGPGDKIVPCTVDYKARNVTFVGGPVSVDAKVMVRHKPNVICKEVAKAVAAAIRSFGYRNVIVKRENGPRNKPH